MNLNINKEGTNKDRFEGMYTWMYMYEYVCMHVYSLCLPFVGNHDHQAKNKKRNLILKCKMTFLVLFLVSCLFTVCKKT